MKLVKTALIGMGALLIVGFLFLSVVLYQRIVGVGPFAKHAPEPAPIDLSALGLPVPVPVPLNQPASMALHLGADARIEAIHTIDNRVLLLVRQPKAADRLYLIDPRTGAVVSAIGLDALPPLPGAKLAASPAATVPPAAVATPASAPPALPVPVKPPAR